MSTPPRRTYASERRSQAARKTKERVLAAAKSLFARRGIDGVTIAEIAEQAEVAASTVYALYRSKEGILRALMSAAIFGQRFQEARRQLDGVTDPVRLIALTASVSRAVYEGESRDLGVLRGASAFSPALRKMEQEFEKIRFDMQEQRLRPLFARGKQKEGLRFDDARRILWMYTSRDLYRMLVHEGRWTPEHYERWLSATLVDALVAARR